MRFEKIQDKYDFFEWFADWCTDGDYLQVEGDDDSGQTFKVYNGCDCLVAEYNTETNKAISY